MASLGGKRLAGESRALSIPLGGHASMEIGFTPEAAGELTLDLASAKGGIEQFKDSRKFFVE